VLKEQHGVAFDTFIEEKVCPLVGDIMYENFGLDSAKWRELSKDIDIIVNGAATTNFFERFEMPPGRRLLNTMNNNLYAINM
jgi:fatty acyl-CoA reductase